MSRCEVCTKRQIPAGKSKNAVTVRRLHICSKCYENRAVRAQQQKKYKVTPRRTPSPDSPLCSRCTERHVAAGKSKASSAARTRGLCWNCYANRPKKEKRAHQKRRPKKQTDLETAFDTLESAIELLGTECDQAGSDLNLLSIRIQKHMGTLRDRKAQAEAKVKELETRIRTLAADIRRRSMEIQGTRKDTGKMTRGLSDYASQETFGKGPE